MTNLTKPESNLTIRPHGGGTHETDLRLLTLALALRRPGRLPSLAAAGRRGGSYADRRRRTGRSRSAR